MDPFRKCLKDIRGDAPGPLAKRESMPQRAVTT